MSSDFSLPSPPPLGSAQVKRPLPPWITAHVMFPSLSLCVCGFQLFFLLPPLSFGPPSLFCHVTEARACRPGRRLRTAASASPPSPPSILSLERCTPFGSLRETKLKRKRESALCPFQCEAPQVSRGGSQPGAGRRPPPCPCGTGRVSAGPRSTAPGSGCIRAPRAGGGRWTRGAPWLG